MQATLKNGSTIQVDVTIGDPVGVGDGHITAAGIDGAAARQLAETIAQNYMVSVAESAPGVCIDGRICTHTMHAADAPTQPSPSVSGGSLLTAFGVAELVKGYYDDYTVNLPTFERLRYVARVLESNGIVLGGHVTESAFSHDFRDDTGASQTGCGLSDQFKAVMVQAGGKYGTVVHDTTEALTGATFAADLRDVSEISTRVADYDSRSALEVLLGDAHKNDTNIEVLNGDHAEVLVVFNYVADTTVDRDALVAGTGKQVFVVDMWYLRKLARAMTAEQADSVAMRDQLYQAMVAFQACTYVTLCDGSHRPAILRPQVA